MSTYMELSKQSSFDPCPVKTMHNTQRTKCTILFLRYLYYNTKLNIR